MWEFDCINIVIVQVLTATSVKIAGFWDVAPYSLIEIDGRFRGTYCLHHRSRYECSKNLRYVENFLLHYTTQHSRRL
jgi:hypothetical protein